MLKRTIALAALVILSSVGTARSDLVYDGVPTPPGDAVGNASAQIMTAIAWFYDALGQWERNTIEGAQISEDERLERARGSFENAVSTLSDAINQLKAIQATNDPVLREALDQELPGPSDRLVGERDVADVLAEFGYEEPATYSDIVDIALTEALGLQGLLNEDSFSDDVDQFRESVQRINERVSRVVLIGIAVGAYTFGTE